MNPRKIVEALIVAFFFILIIYLGVWVRLGTVNTTTVLDYDPWWWYRHAKEIVENNFHAPKWDLLSFYPPGRPVEPFQGWPYTIAFLYKILSSFTTISLTRVAILSPLIMVALIPIPAFFLGRLLSNNIGGLAVALFAVLTPTFLGVSMAGYSDSDAPVVFHMFLSILSMLLLLKYSKEKLRSIPLYAFAIFSNLLFVFNWGGGWLTLILFLAFAPTLIIFRLLEQFIHTWRFRFNFSSIKPELRSILIPLLIVFIITNIAGYMLWKSTLFHSLFGGLSFTGLFGQPLIVNISVAELQTINVFTKSGFWTVGDRIGLAPFLLTFIGLPLLVIYKIFKKEKINFIEIFLFLWWLVMFYLISRGIRFSLFFSVAAAISAGYVVANLFKYIRLSLLIVFLLSLILFMFNPSDRVVLIPLSLSTILFLFSFMKKDESSSFHLASLATAYGVVLVLSLLFVSNAVQAYYSASGMQISQNWYDALDWLKNNADKDSLISTWWDPGHIIAGYTGLKVHADGAHCAPEACIPYSHNDRIRDMGRIFSASNESESVNILNKYKELTPEQCQEARDIFGEKMPDDACKSVSDFYVIASSDLIGKYFWMSCFGSFDMKKWEDGNRNVNELCNGRNFVQLQFSGFDNSGLPTYGNIITLLQKDDQLMAVMNYPQQGVRNAFIKEVVYFQNNQEVRSKLNETVTNALDGMLWIDPSFGVVIFMDPSIRDSVFTKMFFFGGRDLEHFQLMYSNPELKIYKLKL